MSDKISVFTLVSYLKNKLNSDANLQSVLVNGEISNFHHHGSSGHLYFTLKDERAAIACVMFSSKARNLRFEPKNGDKVLVSASVSIFEVSGQLQLYVNSMRMDGLGDLYQRYEELKNKLAAEGYFDSGHKKRPQYIFPEKIAVLVGERSAAMSDIKTQFSRRWPLCEVDYYPVLVQGNEAPSDIISKLKEVDREGYDLIILARGGGSFEDLFCFNDEGLVKTIYSLRTFLVSGVGHEQDYTLCDLVADLRAPTPTAAVELVTPDITDVKESIVRMEELLKERVERSLAEAQRQFDILSSSKYLLNPLLLVENRELQIDYYEQRLFNYSRTLENIKDRIDDRLRNMRTALRNKVLNKEITLKHCSDMLNAFSIEKTLKRGFSIIFKEDRIVRSVKDIGKDEDIRIRMSDGEGRFRIREEDNG